MEGRSSDLVDVANEDISDHHEEHRTVVDEQPALSVAYINPALEHLDIPCGLMTAPGDLLYMNPAFQKVVGRPRAVAFGHRFSEFVHPDDQEKLRTLLKEVAAHPRQNITAQLSLSTGEHNQWAVWTLNVTNALDDARTAGIVFSLEGGDGETVALPRRLALEDTADQVIPVGMNWFARGSSKDGLVELYVDERVRNHLRLSTNRIVDPMTLIHQRFYPDDLAKIMMRLPRLTPQRRKFRTNVRLLRPDGHLGVFELRVFCQYDADGQLISAFGTFEDKSDAVKMASRLAEAKHLLDVVADSAEEVILRLTSDHRISFVTATIEQVFGIERNLVLGRHVTDFEAIHNRENVAAALDEVVQSGKPVIMSIRVNHPEKGTIRVEAHLFPVSPRRADNGPEIIGILREVESFSVKPGVVSSAVAERLKSHFLSHMGQDLRSPLTTVIELADMIVKESNGPIGNEAYLEYADMVRQTTVTLLDTVDDILDVVRWEKGNYRFDFSFHTPEAILARSLSYHLSEIETKQIVIKKVFAPDLPAIECDSAAVIKALHSMISNAVKYSPVGAELALGVRVNEGAIQFAIIDHGAGVDSLVMQDIEALTQGHDASVAQWSERIGVGFTLAFGLIEAHGGQILVKSSDQGTKVIVSIPIRQTEDE